MRCLLAAVLLISALLLFSRAGETGPPPRSAINVLKNADVYAPHPSGMQDIYIAGTSIVAMVPSGAVDPILIGALLNAEGSSEQVLSITDVDGAVVLPGLIDPHMHVTGGGGENGPASRTPSAQLSQIVDGGITTVVGLLGTDGISRSLENLLQMVLSLKDGGLTTYMLTGSYRTPPKTLFQNVEQDVTLVESVIGVGEIAISDHRSSWPSYQELVQIVSDARVGGMLSGSAGVSLFHVGDADSMLDPLWEIVNKTTIPITQMYPTHVSSRGQRLVDEGIRWIDAGGILDFTADEPGSDETAQALNYYRNNGVDLSHVTVSSDAYGSFPKFDDDGNLVSYGVGMPSNIIDDLRSLVQSDGWSITEAFSLSTNNTANVLQLGNKGTLEVGNDADVLVLEPGSLDVLYVMAQGQFLKTPTWTASGMFPCT